MRFFACDFYFKIHTYFNKEVKKAQESRTYSSDNKFRVRNVKRNCFLKIQVSSTHGTKWSRFLEIYFSMDEKYLLTVNLWQPLQCWGFLEPANSSQLKFCLKMNWNWFRFKSVMAAESNAETLNWIKNKKIENK